MIASRISFLIWFPPVSMARRKITEITQVPLQLYALTCCMLSVACNLYWDINIMQVLYMSLFVCDTLLCVIFTFVSASFTAGTQQL